MGRVLGRLAKRTATEFDDILVVRLRAPVVLLITVLSIVIGYQQLVFPDRLGRPLLPCGHRTIRDVDPCASVRCRSKGSSLKGDRSGRRTDGTRSLPGVRMVLRVLVWGLGIVVALNNAGYDVAALVAGIVSSAKERTSSTATRINLAILRRFHEEGLSFAYPTAVELQR
ncbi:MAG: hypothetical protein IPM46_07170 [Flavobacteriales bacterium]|nr:hypothetical protein [Flavobacteriales bacterium]